MAKSEPKPLRSQPPLWKKPRALALVAALVGLLGLGIGARRLFFSGDSGPGAQTLEQCVDEYLDWDQKQSAAAAHEEVEKRVRELAEMMNAPGFGRLPKHKQDALRNRHRELRDYQEYEDQLDQIEDPQNATREEQLKTIRASLGALRIPPQYFTEWFDTAAHQRHSERLADCLALEKAVYYLSHAYQALTRDGQRVLDTYKAENLPQRAREVLDRVGELPDNSSRGAELLPGSRRVTYATAFQFPAVSEAYARWQKTRELLELAVPRKR